MLEEEIHVEALAQEASIEVGEYNQNGFDLAAMFPRLSTDSMPVFSVMRFLFSPQMSMGCLGLFDLFEPLKCVQGDFSVLRLPLFPVDAT
jgi:hypothetical protein